MNIVSLENSMNSPTDDCLIENVCILSVCALVLLITESTDSFACRNILDRTVGADTAQPGTCRWGRGGGHKTWHGSIRGRYGRIR